MGKKKKNRGQLDFVLMDICRLTRQVQMSDAKIKKKNTTLLGFNYYKTKGQKFSLIPSFVSQTRPK